MSRFDQGIGKASVKLGAAAKCPLDDCKRRPRHVNPTDALHPPPLKRRMKFIFMNSSGLEHDPEKCQAVFQKDHAQTKR
jgi:hypothetical protein